MLLMIIGRPSGTQAKSNYELWKESGHPTGTPEEFLASLKGKDGDDNVYIQADPPVVTQSTPALWIQTGLGPQGNGITLNLIRKK